MRVGLLDSGLEVGFEMALSRRFVALGGDVEAAPAVADRHGHGTAMARIVLAAAPRCTLMNAQVFGVHGTTSAAILAAGLVWLIENGARIVNMSLGLAEDRAILRKACALADQAGALLVASVPAMGPAVYPGLYPGVLRVTGDARCQDGEIALIGDGRVDFGACPRLAGRPRISGASVATARVTGALAALIADDPGCGNDQAIARLGATASHFGRQTEHLAAGGRG